MSLIFSMLFFLHEPSLVGIMGLRAIMNDASTCLFGALIEYNSAPFT